MTDADAASLFAEARAVAASREGAAVTAAQDERAALAAAVTAAQDRLLTTLLEGFTEKVRRAAHEGKRETELLAFNGGDTFDDQFCYLFLLKGPRSTDRDACPGVVPLLGTLQNRVAPFRLRHVWKQGTVQNSLVASWAD